jgi:homoserine O-acetyltransferase/O-succinyltransferase
VQILPASHLLIHLPSPAAPLRTLSPTSRLSSLIAAQTIVALPSFKLESGLELHDVPIAYRTWGKLNEAADNCMVICHALTGSADVEDWCVAIQPFSFLSPFAGRGRESSLCGVFVRSEIRWGPLMGKGKAFDPTRFFIVCLNVMGSPYGSLSPVCTGFAPIFQHTEVAFLTCVCLCVR